MLHGRDSDRFPPGFQAALSPEEQRVSALWWEGSFEYGERVFVTAEELDPYLADFVDEHRGDAHVPMPSARERLVGRLKRLARQAQ